MPASAAARHTPAIDLNRATQIQHIEYSRDVVHRHSKAIPKLFNLILSYIEDVEKKVRATGQKALWAGSPWAIPLIYANGYIPVQYSEVGRISGQEAITVAENYFQMPAETCSMVKATIGELFLRRDNGINRLFSLSNACEPFNQAWEVLKSEGYEIYIGDVVYRAPGVDGERYDQVLAYFLKEIRSFNGWLTGDEKINEKHLTRELERRNRLMGKIGTVMDLRLKHPFYVRSLAVMYLMNGLNTYLGKPEEYEEMLDLLLEELLALGDEPEDQDKVIPLVWSGGNGQEFGVYEAIDEANGALLGFVTVPYTKKYDLSIDPVESLARFQLDSMMAGASVYIRDAIEQQIAHVNARGLILYGYLGCSFGSVAREMYRDYFHQKGIPSINIEGTFQVGPPTGQIITRIRAFIEMFS
ncbi:MAG: 2-hydroxyacyl-CoA dehydratase family protein [Clostridiales Family XIII bacterium]|jgi:benzoyl-CoA reductase/2-hydroxyglutaryl-CoA dehydratase subunit BcrC/BadD/HgdB|nr:2-hydroxyacyl-CoA dehydratase family protein [Clostridiales Family XIII bacterium]